MRQELLNRRARRTPAHNMQKHDVGNGSANKASLNTFAHMNENLSSQKYCVFLQDVMCNTRLQPKLKCGCR